MLRLYIDGVQVAPDQNANNIVNPAAGGVFEIGGQSLLASTVPLTISHAAVYDYALSAAQVATHATAATARGYAQATAGTRIAQVATHPLWSTAGIAARPDTPSPPPCNTARPSSTRSSSAAGAESPIGLFYFDDSGNPSYDGWEYDTTIQAVLGDAAGEIPYDALELVYDDDIYNSSTVSREGGDGQTRQDTTSIAQYGVRGHDSTGLPIAYDSDAQLIAQTIVDRFANHDVPIRDRHPQRLGSSQPEHRS